MRDARVASMVLRSMADRNGTFVRDRLVLHGEVEIKIKLYSTCEIKIKLCCSMMR